MPKLKCVGAIIGDIIGSQFEYREQKAQCYDFPLFSRECHFTDDTVCTLAMMEYFNRKQAKDYTHYLVKWVRLYPNAGYGYMFYNWAMGYEQLPYNSFGNGSAMRVSPVIYIAKSEKEAEKLASITASITHNHPEGIKGAVAIAVCGYLARTTKDKAKIKAYAEKIYPRLKNIKIDFTKIPDESPFDVTCQGSVPEAIYIFLNSNSYEDCIRKVMISGCGDTDTVGAMAGAIAEAFYGVPDDLINQLQYYLTPKMMNLINDFNKLIK